jgi:hypothetical protein
MSNDYFEFNDTSCHGLPSFITGLNYQLPTGTSDKILFNVYDIISGFYKIQDITRNPNILNISNLPNNVFFDTGSKYLQGYLEDEGVYNLKLHILESGISCEKTLRLTCYNPNKKYIYKVNYPINIGFIKYNPLERLGVATNDIV